MIRRSKEKRMRKRLAMALLAAAIGVFAVKAEAMPLAGLGQAADALGTVEQAQYFYGGYQYCWYPDGWRGPGFYRCGYHLRRGFGWGGPIGWRGFRHGGGGHHHIRRHHGGGHHLRLHGGGGGQQMLRGPGGGGRHGGGHRRR
jgi:hypothetical protein